MSVIDFPKRKSSWHRPYRQRGSKNKHKLAFRSYEHIVESDEADLVADVCFDMDRAESKLRRVKQRLHNVREEAAAQIELLAAADAKLSAAIVVALLSRGKDEAVPIR
jgi:hypothetical protein